MVECFLAKEDVAGSNPVSRSNNLCAGTGTTTFPSSECVVARYPSGKGEVCKTFMRRFDPDPRLHPIQHQIRDVSFNCINLHIAHEERCENCSYLRAVNVHSLRPVSIPLDNSGWR